MSVKPDFTFQAAQELLHNRPKQLAMLGFIVVRWAHVEQAMAFCYDYLLSQRVDEPREFGWPVDGLGVASFGVVHSFHTKLELLRLAIDWRLGGGVLKEFEASVAASLSAANKARNAVAHGIALASDARPDALIIENARGDEVIYGEHELSRILDSVNSAHDAIVRFHNDLARSMLQTKSD